MERRFAIGQGKEQPLALRLQSLQEVGGAIIEPRPFLSLEIAFLGGPVSRGASVDRIRGDQPLEWLNKPAVIRSVDKKSISRVRGLLSNAKGSERAKHRAGKGSSARQVRSKNIRVNASSLYVPCLLKLGDICARHEPLSGSRMAKDHIGSQCKEVPNREMRAVVPSDFHKVSKAPGQTAAVPIA